MDYVAILNAYADKIGVSTVIVVVVTLAITYSFTTKNVGDASNSTSVQRNDDVTPSKVATSPIVEQAQVEQASPVQATKQASGVQESVKQPLTISEVSEPTPGPNFDTFIASLCSDGIAVKLIKGESSEKDKIIKLNGEGELYWSAKLSALAKKVRLSLTGKKDVIDTVIDIEKVFISPEVDTVVIIQSKNAERSIKFSCKDQAEAKNYVDNISELVNRVKADPNYCSTLVTVKTPVKPKQDPEQQTPGATEAEVPVNKELFVDEKKDSN